MAPEPPVTLISRARQWIALPLWILQVFVAIIGQGIGYGGRYLGLFFFKVSQGVKVHVYWVIVQAHRIVAGLPRWKVVDTLLLGMQPRTPADREVASKDRRLMLVTCACDNPKCPSKGPRYVANPFPDGMPPGVSFGPGVVVERLDRPSEIRDNVITNDPPPPPDAA